MLPWEYRPTNDDDWEDNWLSNSMAWVSDIFVPKWCASEDHWTSRVTEYLYTDCACCLVIRGFAVGLALGLATQIII